MRDYIVFLLVMQHTLGGLFKESISLSQNCDCDSMQLDISCSLIAINGLELGTIFEKYLVVADDFHNRNL